MCLGLTKGQINQKLENLTILLLSIENIGPVKRKLCLVKTCPNNFQNFRKISSFSCILFTHH